MHPSESELRQTLVDAEKVASQLLGAVKAAPIALRENFPKILRTNNFGWSFDINSERLILDISAKTKALPSNAKIRSGAYKDLFLSPSSPRLAAFLIENKLVRIGGGGTIEGHPFQIGRNASFCTFDLTCIIPPEKAGGKVARYHLGVIYVISFGSLIPFSSAAQELDSIMRMTFSEWNRHAAP